MWVWVCGEGWVDAASNVRVHVRLLQMQDGAVDKAEALRS